MKKNTETEEFGGFRSKKVQKTRILPLRWFGNACSYIATNSLVKAFNLQDENNLGHRFKFHSKVWHYVNKPYEWWGTYYLVDMGSVKKFWDQDPEHEELMRKLGSDYDENGVAYWEKYE